MNSKHERNRASRRALYAGLGISAAGHVAALAWLALPVTPIERKAPMVASVAPVAIRELIRLPDPTKPPPEHTTQTESAAGGAGEAGASSAPPASAPSAPAPEPVIASASEGRADLAVVDTVYAPAPAAAPVTVALGRHPAEPDDKVEPQAGAAATMPVHRPGSAARAKGGGAGSNPGLSGAGVDIGRGGITIRTGPKRHPKRHPPRRIPGRRF